MHVDDRLATVLNARAEGNVAMRIQYRQLLDLVGTSLAEARGELLDGARKRLAELARLIPFEERARALGEPGVRLRNPRLIADLAADHPTVALAAIRAARLTEDQWLDLIPALPLPARGLLRHRRDLGAVVDHRMAQLGITDWALTSTTAATTSEPIDAVPAPTAEGTAPARAPVESPQAGNVHKLTRREDSSASVVGSPDGIGAIVRRIEAFRRNREAGSAPHPANDAPRLPLGENEPEALRLLTFAFATDSTGRIGWADAAVSGMIVGLLLPVAEECQSDLASADVAEAFRRRQPIRAAQILLEGAPAIAGKWQVDGAPDFDAAGHFIGYVGRFRRPAPAALPAVNAEADRVRQVLHELRTPVNAIQGFAEIIQQQLFGSTPHEYRALAATIAADAAHMLAGFEDLDRLARLTTGVLQPEHGSSDLTMIVAGIVHQLEAFTATRGSGFALDAAPGELNVRLATTETELLAWRLLATLAGAARPGEILPLSLRADGASVRISVGLPEALGSQEDLFDPAPPLTPTAISAGIFGNGFTLRLIAAEVRAAGGRFSRDGSALALELPSAAAGNSAEDSHLHNPDNSVVSTTG